MVAPCEAQRGTGTHASPKCVTRTSTLRGLTWIGGVFLADALPFLVNLGLFRLIVRLQFAFLLFLPRRRRTFVLRRGSTAENSQPKKELPD